MKRSMPYGVQDVSTEESCAIVYVKIQNLINCNVQRMQSGNKSNVTNIKTTNALLQFEIFHIVAVDSFPPKYTHTSLNE